MILVRNTFHLKFGQAKKAKELLDQLFLHSNADARPDRILTDVTGPYYTFALEFVENDLGAWESNQRKTLSDSKLRPILDEFYTLVESGNREIFEIMNPKS